MAELKWTPEAERWLEEIHDYIARDNPAAAARTIAGIRRQAQMLTEHREIGYPYSGSAGRPMRILLYGHYRIGYRIWPEKDVVAILGVFHGALDLERYLEPVEDH